MKGDKVVAFCDRNCNVIAPFVTASGNRNESPLLIEVLPKVTHIARTVGFNLKNTIVSLDGVYDSQKNLTVQTIVRKTIKDKTSASFIVAF